MKRRRRQPDPPTRAAVESVLAWPDYLIAEVCVGYRNHIDFYWRNGRMKRGFWTISVYLPARRCPVHLFTIRGKTRKDVDARAQRVYPGLRIEKDTL